MSKMILGLTSAFIGGVILGSIFTKVNNKKIDYVSAVKNFDETVDEYRKDLAAGNDLTKYKFFEEELKRCGIELK